MYNNGVEQIRSTPLLIPGLVAQLGEQDPYIATIQFYIWACSSVGERSVRIREVVGSTPIRSTIKSCEILHFTAFLQLFGGFDADANQAFLTCFINYWKY